MRVKNAFTLAEVLITLGIIGVVAAMTMPTLINQTNGAQYKAAYKKALSVISQAVTLNVALDDTSFADTTADSAAADDVNTVNSVGVIIKKRINAEASDTKKTGHETTPAISNDNITFYFNDGAALTLPKTAKGCTEARNCKGFIDVNGVKGPNKETTDAEHPSDIYPVILYNQTIAPNSAAARDVLYK